MPLLPTPGTNQYLANLCEVEPPVQFHMHKGFWTTPTEDWSADGIHHNRIQGRTKYEASIRKAIFKSWEKFTVRFWYSIHLQPTVPSSGIMLHPNYLNLLFFPIVVLLSSPTITYIYIFFFFLLLYLYGSLCILFWLTAGFWLTGRVP